MNHQCKIEFTDQFLPLLVELHIELHDKYDENINLKIEKDSGSRTALNIERCQST